MRWQPRPRNLYSLGMVAREIMCQASRGSAYRPLGAVKSVKDLTQLLVGADRDTKHDAWGSKSSECCQIISTRRLRTYVGSCKKTPPCSTLFALTSLHLTASKQHILSPVVCPDDP